MYSHICGRLLVSQYVLSEDCVFCCNLCTCTCTCIYVRMYVHVGAWKCVAMFAVMFQILFMAVVLYAPALAFEAGALNKCCDPHDVEESVNVGSVWRRTAVINGVALFKIVHFDTIIIAMTSLFSYWLEHSPHPDCLRVSLHCLRRYGKNNCTASFYM